MSQNWPSADGVRVTARGTMVAASTIRSATPQRFTTRSMQLGRHAFERRGQRTQPGGVSSHGRGRVAIELRGQAVELIDRRLALPAARARIVGAIDRGPHGARAFRVDRLAARAPLEGGAG